MLPFAYHDETALHLLGDEDVDRLARELHEHAANLLATRNPQERAILSVPDKSEDIALLQSMMEDLLADASDLVFLGVGGSSLGAQALAQMEGWGTPAYALHHAQPRLHFLDNLDADSSEHFFSALKGEGARFLVISKSGKTLETIAQCLVAVAALREQDIGNLGERFVFLTEPGDNPLRHLASSIGARVFDHDPLLGGRFSVLDSLGAMALLAQGKQVAPMREGASAVLQSLRDDLNRDEEMPLSSPMRGAMAAFGLAQAGYDTAVLLAYGDRLHAASQWHRQLWMESLGKGGHRITLSCALGPVDQHSQLQAWLDGAQTNWFTLLCAPQSGYATPIHAESLGDDIPLRGQTLSGIVEAQWRATEEVLVANGAPLRRIEPNALDSYALGGLFMHFMLETLLTARMMGIDALGQPAVEQVKHATRKHLQRN